MSSNANRQDDDVSRAVRFLPHDRSGNSQLERTQINAYFERVAMRKEPVTFTVEMHFTGDTTNASADS